MIRAILLVSMLAGFASGQSLVNQYCTGCHSEKLKTGNLVLEKLDASQPGNAPEVWEKVVRKVRAGMMPPSGVPRPSRAELDHFAANLEAGLDRAAALKPNPGAASLHRLNRAEYANAIRDLLSLDMDAATLLPADDSSEGFDNIADALAISPALVERYVAAATKISRLAVGDPLTTPSTATYRAPADTPASKHVDGLPLGTQGGMLVQHYFPLDGEYTIKVRSRSGGIGVGGAGASGERLEVVLNGERLQLVNGTSADLKVSVKAGPQMIGAAFVRKSPPGADDMWQTYAGASAVSSLAITGPLNPSGSGDTPSRRRIFTCKPASEREESACVRSILTNLATLAYRQRPSAADLDLLLGFYNTGRKSGSFEVGVEQALARILVDPRFVFRFEKDPLSLPAGTSHRVSDLELASRMSFFLWSSIPDRELIDLAEQGKLHEPAVLEAQTKRMLADPKADALVTNFAGQWLYLRELKNSRPEVRGFTDSLRQAFRKETELLFASIMREDRSVLRLLDADYTFVNEQLAKHYGIPGIKGDKFRRVPVPSEDRRGILGQSSFLLVSSVATRTSPVSRGKWVLENLLGTPAPLPPPNVPPLKESNEVPQPVTLRQRMEEHRQNPVCAACHKIMDPIGFSLENFDLIGRWRTTDEGSPINATGQLVDGTKLDGPASLRAALLDRSDVFVRTMAEKLLTYGTGRALKYYDMPAARRIAADAAKNDNRFSTLILGVVKSDPFQMRLKQ